MSSAKRKFVNALPPKLTVPSWSSSAQAIILSNKMLKRVDESRHPWHTLFVVRNHSPFCFLFVVVVVVVVVVFVIVDCASRLVVEALCGSDQVVIDVIQTHGCPQSCMPNSTERLPEVHDDMVKALLVLQVFLTKDSKIENLLSCAPSCAKTCLFFFDDLLSLWLQSVEGDS